MFRRGTRGGESRGRRLEDDPQIQELHEERRIRRSRGDPAQNIRIKDIPQRLFIDQCPAARACVDESLAGEGAQAFAQRGTAQSHPARERRLSREERAGRELAGDDLQSERVDYVLGFEPPSVGRAGAARRG